MTSDTWYATPSDAEEAFYRAFERADLEDMMKVWADDDAIICIHPMGQRLEGRQAVWQSWRQLFAGGARMRFEVSEIARTVNGDLAVHCVYEKISHGPRLAERSLVLATNVYKETERGWHLVLHHASPAGAMPSDSQEPDTTLH